MSLIFSPIVSCGHWVARYEFSMPFGLYVETRTSFYAFSGPKLMAEQ